MLPLHEMCRKLRRQRSVCRAVLVFVRSNIFRKGERQYRKSMVAFTYQTHSTIDIVTMPLRHCVKYSTRIAYKKAGVMVLILVLSRFIKRVYSLVEILGMISLWKRSIELIIRSVQTRLNLLRRIRGELGR